jgi:hypothetical protein
MVLEYTFLLITQHRSIWLRLGIAALESIKAIITGYQAVPHFRELLRPCLLMNLNGH